MTTARYKFQRSKNSINGFLSKNRASTDALNALSIWSNSKPQRIYNVLSDQDEELLVELTWQESDSSAGPELEDASIKVGIERFHVQQ